LTTGFSAPIPIEVALAWVLYKHFLS
jgi:hypothetical protein